MDILKHSFYLRTRTKLDDLNTIRHVISFAVEAEKTDVRIKALISFDSLNNRRLVARILGFKVIIALCVHKKDYSQMKGKNRTCNEDIGDDG